MNKYVNYLHYIKNLCLFKISLKKFPGNMKADYKNFIFFSALKQKYKNFLKNYNPQTVPKHEYSDKIWWCWLQGEKNAPDLCKACLNSIRSNCPENEVIVITEDNYSDYVSFPDFIIKKYQKGFISRTHFSDLLRLQLLITHGGTWIDSTCYLTEKPTYIFNTPLFVFQNRERGDDSIAASSWLIASEKNNPIIVLVRDMIFDWWKKHNHLFHYFLIHFFLTIALKFYKNEWDKIPFFSNLPCHIMQRELFNQFEQIRFDQIKKMSAVHKLTYKFGEQKLSKTIYEYLLRN
ncbi:MAG: capsular polysaccharide synthesis protein [Treponema sp.]|nr:capsular polysaccharide synthesis protein [Treponema sp.]